ncbi:hypothetical protein [Tateyamaria sp.]|uniref:hypothetical protein n=1 Tax=Tateyamaria sp. TaxID=1929288 RepID=UPI003B21BC35
MHRPRINHIHAAGRHVCAQGVDKASKSPSPCPHHGNTYEPRCIGRYQSDGLPIKQEMSKQKAA